MPETLKTKHTFLLDVIKTSRKYIVKSLHHCRLKAASTEGISNIRHAIDCLE